MVGQGNWVADGLVLTVAGKSGFLEWWFLFLCSPKRMGSYALNVYFSVYVLYL